MTRGSFRHWLGAGLFGLALAAAVTDSQASTPSEGPASPASQSRPRVALVIGNAQYKTLRPLTTTRNDAEDLASAFTKLGFEVTTAFDADAEQMRASLQNFANTLKTPRFRNALAVFYFAGYGLQRAGRNYMLPIAFDVDRDRTKLDQAAIALDTQILAALSQGRAQNDAAMSLHIVVLDACRDDPFGERPGLARVDVPGGTLITFATEAGQKVTDTFNPKAPERNGVYAKQLLQELRDPSPNIDLEKFFKVVKRKVSVASNKEQDPLVMSNLNPLDMASLALDNTKTRASAEDIELWKTVEKSPDLCDFEEYYRRFPKGEFVNSALATMDQIKKKMALTEEAYASLDEDLREKALKSFRDKRAQSETRCSAKWHRSATEFNTFLATSLNHIRTKPLGAWPLSLSHPRSDSFGHVGAHERPARPGMWKTLHARERTHTHNVYPLSLSSYRTSGPFARSQNSQRPPTAQMIQNVAPSLAPTQENGDAEFQATLVNADQGDVDAMYRVALMYEEGSHSVARDTGEMLRWLVLSSTLGNGLASYKLYRYYAEQPTGYTKAVKFKSLAGKQGYYGPVGLNARR